MFNNIAAKIRKILIGYMFLWKKMQKILFLSYFYLSLQPESQFYVSLF